MTLGGVARAPGVQLREVEIQDIATLQLPPLPGTARASALLAAQARQWNWPMQVVDQAQASKSQLHAIRPPRILHLATHGFFLPEEGREDGKGGGQDLRGIGGIGPLGTLGCSANPRTFSGRAAC